MAPPERTPNMLADVIGSRRDEFHPAW
jgi:hypothetical protein